MVNDYDGEHFRKDLPNDAVRLVLAEDNRIPEIRAVLDGIDNARRTEFSDLVVSLRRIRDIIDRR
jgi:hypothetical protein